MSRAPASARLVSIAMKPTATAHCMSETNAVPPEDGPPEWRACGWKCGGPDELDIRRVAAAAKAHAAGGHTVDVVKTATTRWVAQ